MEKIIAPSGPAARFVAADALAQLGALRSRLLPAGRVLLVTDDTVWGLHGEAVAHAIGGNAAVHSLGLRPQASVALAHEVRAVAGDCTALVALGAGTVNDVAKYAAALLGKPYLCVATAASMNGYSSANASLEHRGHKHSYPARAPVAVVADLGMVAAAPPRLAAAGLGDTLCRSAIESDTILAHYLFDAPYPRAIFDRFRDRETVLVAQLDRFVAGDAGYIGTLMEALLDAGDAMRETGSSAVASQGEHMIAHTAELLFGAALRGVMHGELVALATLSSARLQETLLDGEPGIRPLLHPASLFTDRFGAAAPGLRSLYARKTLKPAAAAKAEHRLRARWPEIRDAIAAIRRPSAQLQAVYSRVGLPIDPQVVGLNPAFYAAAVASAYLTRDRFTFLDLAAMN